MHGKPIAARDLLANTVVKLPMKPDSSVPHTPRLLDQVRDVFRGNHYSARTEQAYLYWARLYVRWQGGVGL